MTFIVLPVLLEGSPGVGKTSLIVALGRFSGHKVVRVNLSEQVCVLLHLLLFIFSIPIFYQLKILIRDCLMQTDMMDLLGSDLPAESEEEIKFSWSDGILLQVKLLSRKFLLYAELSLSFIALFCSTLPTLKFSRP